MFKYLVHIPVQSFCYIFFYAGDIITAVLVPIVVIVIVIIVIAVVCYQRWKSKKKVR